MKPNVKINVPINLARNVRCLLNSWLEFIRECFLAFLNPKADFSLLIANEIMSDLINISFFVTVPHKKKTVTTLNVDKFIL